MMRAVSFAVKKSPDDAGSVFRCEEIPCESTHFHLQLPYNFPPGRCSITEDAHSNSSCCVHDAKSRCFTLGLSFQITLLTHSLELCVYPTRHFLRSSVLDKSLKIGWISSMEVAGKLFLCVCVCVLCVYVCCVCMCPGCLLSLLSCRDTNSLYKGCGLVTRQLNLCENTRPRLPLSLLSAQLSFLLG